MNLFNFLFRTAGAAVKGAEDIDALSNQVQGHLTAAQVALDAVEAIAADHHDHTSQTVSNLQSMITAALDENARVQAAAKNVTAAKDAITQLINPPKEN